MEETIKHFYSRIQNVPQLLNQATIIDTTLSSHFAGLQSDAAKILQLFETQKEESLQKFDVWLLPIAKEVYNELTQDAAKLKSHLEAGLQNEKTLSEMDWIAHAKKWAHFYSKWQDKNALTQRILVKAAERATQLVDKDIQLLKEYQNHLISQSDPGLEEVQEIERRLKKATEESLKRLIDLKKHPEELSIKQVSDWLATLYTKRATYFDHLLMKIDSFVKDIIQIEESQDPQHFAEIEGELKFIEYELFQINEMVSHVKDKGELDVLRDQLDSMIEHLEQFDQMMMPKPLRIRFAAIENQINATENRLNKAG